MAVISVTRLHLRSLRFLPPFAWHTWRSARQLRASAGFVHGRFANELPYGFWTMTVWRDVGAIRAFRDSAAHRVAMKKLLGWCDEASFVHWEADGTALPPPTEAHARLLQAGQTSKVNHPSAAHRSGRTAADRIPDLGPLLGPAGQ
jgi:hypothetical protein